MGATEFGAACAMLQPKPPAAHAVIATTAADPAIHLRLIDIEGSQSLKAPTQHR
jgi:hypothetical protein